MKKTLLLLLFVCLRMAAQSDPYTQTFNGSFNNPDGTAFNGYFSIGLVGSTFKDTCANFQVVPSDTQKYPVIDGQIQGISSAKFVSQECLTPRKPYYVALYDAQDKPLYTDNWYLPRLVGGTINVGMMQAEHMGTSPIQVALPQGIVATPSQSQSITQPAGTSFTITAGTININGTVVYSTPPNFTQINTTQVLVGGITSSSYPLDVRGLVDATGGYLVNESGGTSGQCLVSNGTAFVPYAAGGCPQPTLSYQTVKTNGSALPAQSNLNFSSNFSVANGTSNGNTGTGGTNVDLATFGAGAKTYSTPSSITIDATGRVYAVTTATATPTATQTCSGTSYPQNCYSTAPDGTLTQWGSSSPLATGSSTATTTVYFGKQFASGAIVACQATPDNTPGTATNVLTMMGTGVTTSYFSISASTSFGDQNISTTVHAMWVCIGH